MVQVASNLKVRKLMTFASYNLPLEIDLSVEHGCVENFCKLFKLRETLRRIRMEIAEKEYILRHTLLWWGILCFIVQFSGNVLSLKSSLFKPRNQLLLEI